MSANWITLIPENPIYVPDEACRRRARERFFEIAPESDEIEIRMSEKISFFNCGANFERVRCPSCESVLSHKWWSKLMDEDYANGGFELAGFPAPCCGVRLTLHELKYEWPQGFGRFAIEAKNPNIGELDDSYKREFESILQVSLRVIYKHI